ncbi:MAG TPA: hypothetical protein VHX11_00480 [Acidobacteriaceae bacterium]|jgi:hypothetical protein|nr:hypothetical protein [Acidobacteriaceae bacterium]
MPQLFLDCDGVLADFDVAAALLFGQHPREAEAVLGTDMFWSRLRGDANFYGSLPLMADGIRLYQAVAHLNPIILTGCPRGGWAEQQKVEWAARHFPHVPIITCRSAEKWRHLQSPGDILVDDFVKYRHLWKRAGGIFVLHRTAEQTIEELAELGLPVRHENLSRTPEPGP